MLIIILRKNKLPFRLENKIVVLENSQLKLMIQKDTYPNMQPEICKYTCPLQTVLTKFWVSICDPCDYWTVSKYKTNLAIN